MLTQDTCTCPKTMTRRPNFRRAAHLLSALALGAVLVPYAHAQTPLTWDGNTATAGAQDGSGTWDPNTTANWYNGTADQLWGNPTAPANIAQFGVGGTSGTVTLAGTLNVSGLTFNQGGYTLNATTSGGGILNFIPATAGGSVVLTTSGAGQVSTINDNVGFTATGGNANSKFTKTGAGTLVLSQTNNTATVNIATPNWTITGGTFNTGTALFDSVLQIGGAAGRLGNNPTTVTLDAGTLRLSALFGNSSIAGPSRSIIVTANGGAFVDGTSGVGNTNNTIDGPITDNAGTGTSLYLSNSAGIVTRITSAISGTGGVTWSGGTGTFSAASTYTGATVVNSGVMAVTGSLASGSAVTVGGGTLAGTGTVAGPVTVTATGKINPGAVGTVGKLTTGAITFVSGSTVVFDFGGNAVDSLASTGLVGGLSGTNFVFNSIGGAALTNTSYTLVSAGSFANTTLPTSVSGLPTGYQLQYSGNNLNLVVAAAPEPSQFAAFGLGLLGLGGLALRARRRSHA